MSDSSRCFLHGLNPIPVSYWGHITGVERKFIWARITIDDEDYDAKIRKNRLHRLYRRKSDIEGRYIAIPTTKKKLFLCDCRWTKEQIDEVYREGKKLAEKLKMKLKEDE